MIDFDDSADTGQSIIWDFSKGKVVYHCFETIAANRSPASLLDSVLNYWNLDLELEELQGLASMYQNLVMHG